MSEHNVNVALHEALDDAPMMNAAEVITYLQNHPDFFVEHAEALAGLPLPLAMVTGRPDSFAA